MTEASSDARLEHLTERVSLRTFPLDQAYPHSALRVVLAKQVLYQLSYRPIETSLYLRERISGAQQGNAQQRST